MRDFFPDHVTFSERKKEISEGETLGTMKDFARQTFMITSREGPRRALQGEWLREVSLKVKST